MLDFFISLISPTFGKKRYQPFYQKLHSLSLRGLNYGMVDSGEEEVLKRVSLRMAKSKKPLVLFDVGANIGKYALTLLKTFPESSNIYGFEPSKKTFEELKRNLGVHDVKLFNIGFGEKKEHINLYSIGENTTLASAYQRESNENETVHVEQIEISTIDAFCKNHNIDKIDFLKVDVEGYEINVFKGASEMFKNNKINTIQFEFGGTQIEPRVFIRDFYSLFSPNYNLFRILKDGLEPIKKYNERLENFSYSNYLAVLKNEN